MTISSTTARKAYAGDGSTAFATEFKFYDNAHLRAVLRDADGLEELWAEGSDYTLSGAGDEAGGTLTASVAPVSGETLVLSLAVPQTQTTDLPVGGAFPADAVEQMSDRTVQMLLALNQATGPAVQTLGVSTSAKTIAAELNPAALLLVFGTASGTAFADLVLHGFAADPASVFSLTVNGSPPVRTYSRAGADLQLAVASGSFTVTARAIVASIS
jgi:hypothetical protein